MAGIRSINAVTVVTTDMAAAVAFYDALGFALRYGGADSEFTSYEVGDGYLNVQAVPAWSPPEEVWGRVIFHVDDVDAMYRRAVDAGYAPSTEPADAVWGERYFHLSDPDGHELSFARLLEPGD